MPDAVNKRHIDVNQVFYFHKNKNIFIKITLYVQKICLKCIFRRKLPFNNFKKCILYVVST